MSARNNVPRTRVPLSLRCVEARNKEKLEFTEDFCAMKSFSEGSIFLKGSIDDVNEDGQTNVSNNAIPDRDPKKPRMYIWKPKRAIEPNVSFNLLRIASQEDSLENKSRESSRSNIVRRNNIGDGCSDLQCLCRVHEPSKRISKYTLTKTDKTRSITERSVPNVEGKDILSRLWGYALLANQSSNNSCLSADSLYHNNPANYTRYCSERHTFLNGRSIVRNNNRRVLNPTRIFDFAKCLSNDPYPCESRLAISK